MQSVSSRIWTYVAVSISYDDNDYTTGTSTLTSETNKNLKKNNVNKLLSNDRLIHKTGRLPSAKNW